LSGGVYNQYIPPPKESFKIWQYRIRGAAIFLCKLGGALNQFYSLHSASMALAKHHPDRHFLCDEIFP
jgi:hypothetical protein